MFWAAAATLLALTLLVVLRPLFQGNTAPDKDGDRAMQVYKDQLSEVEKDRARGVLSEAEASNLRAEVARRILAADADAKAPAGTGTGPRLAAALGGAGLLLVGAAATYSSLGAPGVPDLPRATALAENAARYAARPSQAEVLEMMVENGTASVPPIEAEQAELIQRLRDVLQSRPDDLRGHRLLASSLGQLGQWPEAALAQAEVLRILGEDAPADDYVAHAEFQIFSVNGYVSPEAEADLRKALKRDPQHPQARYFSGLSALQAGRADIAYDLWIRLLDELPNTTPLARSIRGQIAEVALAAGRPVPSVADIQGPTAEDIATADSMSEEDRAAMISGMVARLSDRLATEGGPPEDWARLIRAYGVLGERAQASRIWNEAQDVFADSPAALSILRQAARDAEVAQ